MTTTTKNQEVPDKEFKLLSSEERAVFSQIAATEPPHSQRAQALLVINEGATQAEAGRQSGLTIGQVRYWLGRFRKNGLSIFPEELLVQEEEEADIPQDLAEPEPPADESDLKPAAGEEEVQLHEQ